MALTGWKNRLQEIKKLQSLLVADAARVEKHKQSSSGRIVSASKNELLASIKKISSSGSAELIITMEITLVEHDLEYYDNHRLMKASLKADLKELAVIKRQLAIVDDLEQYKHIDAAYSLPKSRKQGLPLDEARQSFRSHSARLDNQAKSPLSDTEKESIDARKTATNVAEKDYIERQARTLGVELAGTSKESR